MSPDHLHHRDPHAPQADAAPEARRAAVAPGKRTPTRALPPGPGPTSRRDEQREVADLDANADDGFHQGEGIGDDHRDARATVEPRGPFADDDPFGLHLIGEPAS